MVALIDRAIGSLDGYVADEDGSFDWGVPDEAVHTCVYDVHRPIGTALYGRRPYEVMVALETVDVPAESPAIQCRVDGSP